MEIFRIGKVVEGLGVLFSRVGRKPKLTKCLRHRYDQGSIRRSYFFAYIDILDLQKFIFAREKCLPILDHHVGGWTLGVGATFFINQIHQDLEFRNSDTRTGLHNNWQIMPILCVFKCFQNIQNNSSKLLLVNAVLGISQFHLI